MDEIIDSGFSVEIPVEQTPVSDAPVVGADTPSPAPSDALEGTDLPGDALGTLGTIEVIEAPPRLFFTTPFSDYTVTEGLLLAILLALIISALWHFVKEAF